MTSPQVPLRDAIRTLPAYVPGARATAQPDVVKLSSNENPFPPLEAVREAVARAATEINRYPDMFATELGEAIADRHGVVPQAVVPGCGSVAVLGHVLQAFCDAGDEVVHAWRSFEAYPIAVRLTGAVAVTVPLTADGRHDLPAMAAAITPRTRVVLVCSPNNPTGPTVRDADLRTFLAAVPPEVLVVLDEAYVEFVRDPLAAAGDPILADHPNVVLLRTFSKAYGLAGLRVGYAVTHPDLARGIRTAATPFGVSHLAQVAALASLQATDELLARVEVIVERRAVLLDGLRGQGWSVPESQANFVWLATGDRTAEHAAEASRAGLLVRPFAGEGLRISVGEEESLERLLALTGSWR